MRQTHATFALAHGAELTTVRDNLRHASISMTSIYLHGDAVKRERQIAKAFTESSRRCWGMRTRGRRRGRSFTPSSFGCHGP
jgi:hypothetical protein